VFSFFAGKKILRFFQFLKEEEAAAAGGGGGGGKEYKDALQDA
jgi:hypothetical protein